MAVYKLSLAIEADNPIVHEWRHMLTHILNDGAAVTAFYLDTNGDLAIETTLPITNDTRDHLKLTEA